MRASRALGATILVLAVAACRPLTGIVSDKPDELVLRPAAFTALEDWPRADVRAAFGAFQASCRRVTGRADGDGFGPVAAYGSVGDWRSACSAALQTTPESGEEARRFFEAWFSPVQAFNKSEPVGLFTGYYEPELRAARSRGGEYQTPLLRRPRGHAAGQVLPTRAQIARGELIHVIPGWAPQREVVHAVFASRRGMLPAVRALVDFLAQAFARLKED